MDMNDIMEMVKDYKPNYVGIGKMTIDTKDAEYEIPQLHFLVSMDDGYFSAVCIEFSIVSIGDTPVEAADRLADMVIEYVRVSVEKLGFDSLIGVVSNTALEKVWAEYRRIEFTLAKCKKNSLLWVEKKTDNAKSKHTFSTNYNLCAMEKAA